MRLKHLLATVAALAAYSAGADIWMPSFFNANMVLQREKPVKIWGTSDANAKIEISFAGQKKSAKADADGNWVVTLDPMKASDKGADLRVLENGKAGNPKSDITLPNVLVGEVWLLSGQSNMEWPLRLTTDYEKAKSRANYPAMREMKIIGFTAEPQKNIESGSHLTSIDVASGGAKDKTPWRETTPESIAGYSGVGFYFAEFLQKNLGVPVGIINTSLGGSAMRAWIPEGEMEKVPFLKRDLEKYKIAMAEYDYDAAMKKYEANMEKFKADKAAGKKVWPPKKPNPISCRNAQGMPSGLYNARIAPIAGFAIRGILWYQGESDSFGDSLAEFEEQMKTLVPAWRKAWNDQSLGFYQVMLTSFQTGWKWPETRLAQCRSAQSIPGCYIVNIMDIGAKKDIHPRNKTDVGKRLWLCAWRNTYGNDKIPDNFAAFDTAEFKGDCAKVGFGGANAGRKFTCKGTPRGFEVKSKGKWIKAPFAELEGDKIVLHTNDNSEIEGVRYLWNNVVESDDVCLWLADDMPVFPSMIEKQSD